MTTKQIDYQRRYLDILRRTAGKEETVGTWIVRGEDPNCDMGGCRHQPIIGVLHGSLKNAILWAVKQSDFYTWGRGGDIAPINVIEV